MTEPLTPIDLDLRDFGFMPLEVVRLRDSDLAALATGDEFRAAVLLWCAAWHQVPAASLPADDRLLAKLAGFGRDLKGWNGVKKEALRGFLECSDGRLYHPVIADIAIEAGTKKKKQSGKTAKATEARIRKAEEARNAKRGDDRDDDRDGQRNDHQGIGRERNGEEGIDPPGQAAERDQQLPLGQVAPAKRQATKRRPNARTAIDPNWHLPEEGREYARKRGWPERQIDLQFEKFKNFHAAKGNLMADWLAAWRTWVGNDYDRQPPRGGPPQAPSRADTAIEGMMAGLTEGDFHARSR
ncbi:DUF1376 domain-containing protein [Bradyrhizobium erythrophlei]|uniref:DUF1376 domain-containing protein n=1 Tax=Bradyrhizobium erythrophlei TaxID=1437360 RepID=A0A1H4NMH5_9BRAD|nr:DUF1376 domain-containing protein [Bradyrhizobium erythrophlei]SEB96304.1 Protein of unknown function [Bradyrhizobium erythrophlei]